MKDNITGRTAVVFGVSAAFLLLLFLLAGTDRFQHDVLSPSQNGENFDISTPLNRRLADSGQYSDAKQTHVIVVDLRDHFLPRTTKLAVQACAGLYNRPDEQVTTRPIVYTLLNDPEDGVWLKELNVESNGHNYIPFIHPHRHQRMDGYDFLVKCLQDFPRRIRYRYYGPARRVVPNVVTMGAMLAAIPIEDGDWIFDKVDPNSLTIVFDAITHTSFAANNAHDATEFVYDTYGKNTTSMAKINPGYNTSMLPTREDQDEPPLVNDMDISLIDFVYSQKLFAFYLYYGCIKWWNPMHSHNSHKLVARMAADRAGGAWPNPVPVYGYDDSWNILGGDLFEAETMCVGAHDLGQIATEGVNNLSFFSRWSAKVVPGEINVGPDLIGRLGDSRDSEQRDSDERVITEELIPSLADDVTNAAVKIDPDPTIAYDMAKTYVALVIGDGDNILYMKSSRADWMRQRQRHCQQMFSLSKKRCFPITWTVSSHLAHVAPDILRWYSASATSSKLYSKNSTSLDTFILPPSGHLYSYPGMMPDDVQDKFIEATEEDALLLNTSGVIDWEWFTRWSSTEANFYPKYAKKGIIRGIFTINVPFLFPTGRFLPGEFFKVIEPPIGYDGRRVVMFRPREWRGTPADNATCRVIPVGAKRDYLSPADLAEEIGAYPRGTVTYIYLTSDGGLTYHDIAEMAERIPNHVELVSTEMATALALNSHERLQHTTVSE